jgi:hypothetical protein
MSEAPDPTRTTGAEVARCPACGAPLATDQRYCLNCGARRGAPRIDFRRHLGTPVARAEENGRPPAAETPPAPPPGPGPQRDYAPLAAVGGIAVLGLMLLVGVLIGRGDGGSEPAPAPVVVRGGEAEPGGESENTADTGKPGKEAAAKKAGAEINARKAGSAGSLTGGGAEGGPVEASDEALKELQESPDYSKESAKLPNEIATGGEPPPKDDKAPGGGSKATAVE